MRIPIFIVLQLFAVPASAEKALVAVATNFRPVAEIIAAEFGVATGHEVRLTSAATGKLAAQISSGAPFDLFLSADSETPDKLIAGGFADAEGRVTYAIGHLALWSSDAAANMADPAAYLTRASRIAIANPKLAPYGKAAEQAIDKLGFSGAVAGKVVYGENIGQTFSLVYSGAADAGFVAVSSVADTTAGGTHWLVPDWAHDPIRQDAVMLIHGRTNVAATGFLAFLNSPEARAIIERSGYGTSP